MYHTTMTANRDITTTFKLTTVKTFKKLPRAQKFKRETRFIYDERLHKKRYVFVTINNKKEQHTL